MPQLRSIAWICMRTDTNKQSPKYTHSQWTGTDKMKISNREREAKQRRGKETCKETIQSNGSKIKTYERKCKEV